MRFHVQFRSFRHSNRCPVAKLPIEVVMRDVQHGLFPAIRKFQRIRHVLSAEMHVRHHVHEFRVGEENGVGGRACQLETFGGIANFLGSGLAVVLSETYRRSGALSAIVKPTLT